MATLRKHRNKWQSLIRIQGHPALTKSFTSRTAEMLCSNVMKKF